MLFDSIKNSLFRQLFPLKVSSCGSFLLMRKRVFLRITLEKKRRRREKESFLPTFQVMWLDTTFFFEHRNEQQQQEQKKVRKATTEKSSIRNDKPNSLLEQKKSRSFWESSWSINISLRFPQTSLTTIPLPFLQKYKRKKKKEGHRSPAQRSHTQTQPDLKREAQKIKSGRDLR